MLFDSRHSLHIHVLFIMTTLIPRDDGCNHGRLYFTHEPGSSLEGGIARGCAQSVPLTRGHGQKDELTGHRRFGDFSAGQQKDGAVVCGKHTTLFDVLMRQYWLDTSTL